MGFPFKDNESSSVITCTHILESKAAILYVSRDEDDGTWTFLCGLGHESNEVKKSTLKHMYDIDNSLSNVADLEMGFFRERDSVSSDWKKPEKS